MGYRHSTRGGIGSGLFVGRGTGGHGMFVGRGGTQPIGSRGLFVGRRGTLTGGRRPISSLLVPSAIVGVGAFAAYKVVGQL